MRTGVAFLALAGALACACGCGGRQVAPPEMVAGVFGESEMESRYQAAVAISEPVERDDALAAVALLDAMRPSPAKDDAAYRCATRLADAGWMQEAVSVAKKIGDAAKRDRALARIAERSTMPSPQ